MDGLTTLELLQWAAQRAERLFRASIADRGISLRDVIVLKAVARRPGLTQTELMQASGIDRSTTSDIVRKLVDSGNLRRDRSTVDARNYSIHLTRDGLGMLDEIEKALVMVEGQLADGWSQTALSEFTQSLRKLLHAGRTSASGSGGE